MATGRAFGGKEFSVRLGRRDQSATAVGTAVSTDAHTLSPVVYRLNGLNDIAWDAGYQRTELDRSGTRVKRAEDIINHYGSGVWTWDFDWTIDNEVGLQNLLDLLYPSNANGAAHASGWIVPASPTVVSYAHGVQGSQHLLQLLTTTNRFTLANGKTKSPMPRLAWKHCKTW